MVPINKTIIITSSAHPVAQLSSQFPVAGVSNSPALVETKIMSMNIIESGKVTGSTKVRSFALRATAATTVAATTPATSAAVARRTVIPTQPATSAAAASGTIVTPTPGTGTAPKKFTQQQLDALTKRKESYEADKPKPNCVKTAIHEFEKKNK